MVNACNIVLPVARSSCDCGMETELHSMPICSSMCLTRVRPASLGNKVNAKACESDAPSQWGIKPVSVAVGSWRCQPVVQTRVPWGYSGTANNHQSAYF
jgi:hypothetical protein